MLITCITCNITCNIICNTCYTCISMLMHRNKVRIRINTPSAGWCPSRM